MPKRRRTLLKFTLAVVRRPVRTLILCALSVVACGTWARLHLNVSTDQNKLFSPNVGFFRDYLNFINVFPENEATAVILESASSDSPPPPTDQWTAAADAIVRKLTRLPQDVKAVDYRVPIRQLGDQGLLFDSPENVLKTLHELQRFAPLARLWGEKPSGLEGLLGPTPMQRFLAALNTQKPSAEVGPFLALLARSWTRTVADPAAPLAQGSTLPDLTRLGATDPSRLGYYYVPDEQNPQRHLLLIQVYPRRDFSSLTAIVQSTANIRAAVADAMRPFPQFKAGLTGRPTLEADEMETTSRDSHHAEICALIAVFIGLAIMLRSLWLALAAEVALAVGIGWTFGWATLTLGQLNLLSIVFLIALIGIGMDYLVQILTRYRREQARRPRPKAVWTQVFRHVATPINTACMGAAGAFLVSTFTDFRGAADLGIIAGGGLILCLIAGYTVLPALLTLRPARPASIAPAQYYSKPRPNRWYHLIPPLLWMIGLAAIGHFAVRASFDPNLLNLQAQNLESVQLVRKLQTFSAVVMSKDLDVLRKVRDAVKSSPLVKSTDSILNAYDNAELLHQHAGEVPAIAWTSPAPVEANQIGHLKDSARSLSEKYLQAGDPGGAGAALKEFVDAVGVADAKIAAARLSEWETAFVAQLKDMLSQLSPGPIDIQKLPPELRNHLVGTDGSYALYILPTKDLWPRANLVAFEKDVEHRVATVSGAPAVTGITSNVYHTISSVQRSFYEATAYALALILILVFADLRDIRKTLAAVSVLALGLPMLVSLLGMLDVSWNFANFFGLPILIGAGHEYGVFLVHRYQEARKHPERAWRAWDVSDRALLLCAYVTTTSFGFFWFLAHHRGLRSLGLVMTLGTVCIYLSAVMVLRPLLLWRLGNLVKKAQPAPAKGSDA